MHSELRRKVLLLSGLIGGALISPIAQAQKNNSYKNVVGKTYWVNKPVDGGQVKIHLWRKNANLKNYKGIILFVHGSSMAGTPTFDLDIPGAPEMSVMNYFSGLGYDTWCADNEGYGRSDKSRNINFNVANGADDLTSVVDEITRITGEKSIYAYGVSSGGLKAALYAQNNPGRISRLALDAFVWTGKDSPTLAERKKRLALWQSSNRRPVNHAMIESVFTRDHPGTADPKVVTAFADAVTALDDSMPTGTYLDMSANLPLVDPEKLNLPILIMRGQYDGIAAFSDVLEFFAKLPHPDKQFSVMQGIAHASFQEKNFQIPYHVLESFYSQPKPVYIG
jgi:pimeloyl-ACP methyl ester carboxylesterase